MLYGDAHHGIGAVLAIHDWRACQRMLQAGDIGFAEAYAAGWISTPELTPLLRLALRNEDALDKVLELNPRSVPALRSRS